MAEEQDNLVVRMLREIRSGTSGTRPRVSALKRHKEELRDQGVTTMGTASTATDATGRHGEGMDAVPDPLEPLGRRVAASEARR
jgi:hypothetical protein